jgi:hypothetical protein
MSGEKIEESSAVCRHQKADDTRLSEGELRALWLHAQLRGLNKEGVLAAFAPGTPRAWTRGFEAACRHLDAFADSKSRKGKS